MSASIHSIEKIKSAIAVLDGNDRKTVIDAAVAIRAEIGDQGFDTWYQLGRHVFGEKEDARYAWANIVGDAGIQIVFEKAKSRGWKYEQLQTPGDADSLQITVLRAQKHVGKRYRFEGGEIVKKSSYPEITHWHRFELITVPADVEAVCSALSMLPNTSAITLSKPIDDSVLTRTNVLRRAHDAPDGAATLKGDDCRLFVLDIDNFELSDPFDADYPSWAADEVRARIGLGDYSCFWQISSSQKLHSTAFKGRLGFVIDKAVPLKTLKAAALAIKADGAVFHQAQPIYTAAPIFENGDDPIHERWGVLLGEADILPSGVIQVFASEQSRGSDGYTGGRQTYLNKGASKPSTA